MTDSLFYLCLTSGWGFFSALIQRCIYLITSTRAWFIAAAASSAVVYAVPGYRHWLFEYWGSHPWLIAFVPIGMALAIVTD